MHLQKEYQSSKIFSFQSDHLVTLLIDSFLQFRFLEGLERLVYYHLIFVQIYLLIAVYCSSYAPFISLETWLFETPVKISISLTVKPIEFNVFKSGVFKSFETYFNNLLRSS